jgi:hypothetical protein
LYHILVRSEGWKGSLSYFRLAYFWLAIFGWHASLTSRAGLATPTTKTRFSCRFSADCAKPPYQLNLRLSRIDLSNEKVGLTKIAGSRVTNLLDATQIPAGGL